MKKTIFATFLMCVLFISTQMASAQTDSLKNKLSFSLSGDLVNRFYFRGQLLSQNPNIQPFGAIAYKGLTFGVFGSYGISTPYAETDLSLSYTIGSLSFAVTDYYPIKDDSLQNYNFFKYGKGITKHSLEGSIIYRGTETFPITLTAATFFNGNDDFNGDGKVDYSTYLEVAYTAKVSDIPLKMFIGGTPHHGFYATKASVVNIGVNATKQLKFSKELEIPVYATFAINPDSNDVFVIFGITF